jgi:hypothetical protein
MESYELYVPEIKKKRWNIGDWRRGKKWDEIYSKDAQERILKSCRGKKAAYNNNADKRKEVVMIKDGKICGIFESASTAARHLGGHARNICSAANGRNGANNNYKRKTAYGFEWKWSKEIKWNDYN